MTRPRSSSTNKKRLPRRPIEQTRDLMLEAATRLLLRSADDPSDDALADAVAHIRVTDVVVEAAGLAAEQLGRPADEFHPFSIGALYQIWPTQPEFQRELLMQVAAVRSTVYPEPSTGADALDRTVFDAWTHHRSDPMFRVSLAMYPRVAHPQIREVLAAGYRDFTDNIIDAWQTALDAAGRRPRPPYDVTHIARAVAGMIEGFSLQWLADPTALADPEGDPDTDLALRSIHAVLDAFTEPVRRTRRKATP